MVDTPTSRASPSSSAASLRGRPAAPPDAAKGGSPQGACTAQEDTLPLMERWLVMPKLLYFTVSMFVYAFHGIMPLIFIDAWKFDYYQLGYSSILMVVSFFGSMFWTSQADRTGKCREILIVSSIAYTVMGALLMFPDFAQYRGSTAALVIVFAGLALFNFFLSAAYPLVDSQVMAMLKSNPRVSKSDFGYQRMWSAGGHFTATLLSYLAFKKFEKMGCAAFQAVVTVAFVATIYYGVSNGRPRRSSKKHGAAGKAKQAVSAAIPSSQQGAAMSEAAGDRIETLSVSSSISLSSTSSTGNDQAHQVSLVDTLPLAPTPAPPSAGEELMHGDDDGINERPVATLLSLPSFVMFLLFVCSAGIVRSISGAFQKNIVHEAGTLGASSSKKDLMGTALTEAPRVVSEVFVYMISASLKQSLGAYWILVLSQVVSIVRLFGYGCLPFRQSYTRPLVWLLELLKGFSSGLVSSSAIQIAGDIAPAGCERTAQGLYSGMYAGLSMAISGFISGGYLQYRYLTSTATSNAGQDITHVMMLHIWVGVVVGIITLVQVAKFIFIDRVMGFPGFPRRSEMA